MMKRAGLMLSLCLSICVGLTMTVSAQEKGKKKAAARLPTASTQAFSLPKEIELTTEQKAKLEELKKELTPKLDEAQKKLDSLFTDDQKKARLDAFTKARAEGKKAKDLKAAYESAVTLTDEQKKQVAAAQKEVDALVKSAREKMVSLLNEEQKSKIKGAKKKNA